MSDLRCARCKQIHSCGCAEYLLRELSILETERDRLKADSAGWEDKYLKMLMQRNDSQEELSRLKAELIDYEKLFAERGYAFQEAVQKAFADRDAWKAKAEIFEEMYQRKNRQADATIREGEK